MKRKYLALSYLLLLSLGTILSLYTPKTETAAAQQVTAIPDEAIRLRILANSDAQADQDVKRKIRDAVNADIAEWVKTLTSIDEAREVIQSHLPDIQARAEETAAAQGLDQSVAVTFGKAQFPTKLYGQYLYPAGEYEAIVITLGEGSGANWWCVLFPPLCFLDFSNGTAVSQSPIIDEQADGDSADDAVMEASAEAEANPVPADESEDEPGRVAAIEPNVYTGEEEEPIQTKSLVAELFAKWF